MAELMENIEYLSRQVGAHPAGTEEEQQAALYIADCIQRDSGLPTTIEDIDMVKNTDLPFVILPLVAALCAILAIVLPAISLLFFLLTVAAVALMVMELIDRPVLSRFLSAGVSQNVVARYTPGAVEGKAVRKRRIVVVAHYDDHHVRNDVNGPLAQALPIINKMAVIAPAAVAILLLLKLPLGSSGADMVLNVLLVVAAIASLVPAVLRFLETKGDYSEGANCNASAVAVLMETAARVGQGRVSEADLARAPRVHGEYAARNSGLFGDDVALSYEVEPTFSSAYESDSSEDRLAAAKAAIAALTGKAVAGAAAVGAAARTAVAGSAAGAAAADSVAGVAAAADDDFDVEFGVPMEADGIDAAYAPASASAYEPAEFDEAGMAVETVEVAEAAAEAADEKPMEFSDPIAALQAGVIPQYNIPIPEPDDPSKPAWFKNAMKNARKPENEAAPQRSRYATAFENLKTADELAAEAAAAAKAEAEAAAAAAAAAKAEAEAQAAAAAAAAEPVAEYTPVEVSFETAPEMVFDNDAAAAADAEVAAVAVGAAVAEAAPVEAVSATVAGVFEAEAQAAVAETPTATDAFELPEFLRNVPRYDASMQEPAPLVSLASEPEPIVLPDITASNLAPIQVDQHQSSVLADAAEGVSRPRITALPAVIANDLAIKAETGQIPLVSTLPSNSGIIASLDEATVAMHLPDLTEQPVGSAGMTGSFAPVGEAIIANAEDDEDLIIDDADDSDFEENFTQTGAFAGPGYVEMPKSRFGGFFDRLFGKKEKESSTPQEWLDVDDDFDAREVGKARGDWESFREDDLDAFDDQNANEPLADEFDAPYDQQDAEYAEGSNGGYDGASNGGYDAGYDDFDDFDDFEDDPYADNGYEDKGAWGWRGGAYSSSRMNIGRVDVYSGVAESGQLGDEEEPPMLDAAAEEMERIYQFRHPDINTEVWFVALGSELMGNAGMKAFLAEHAQELRGAVIIDLEAMGAGELCLVENEGRMRKVTASSRMKRYLKKAQKATGVGFGTTDMLWRDSAASVAAASGMQTMHLVGMDGSAPMFYASKDDVLENVDEDTLYGNADFVMELLKTI